jgi:Meiotically up-regulated gene 113
VPTLSELQLARASDASFPTPKVFQRLGSKNERVGRALSFCRDKLEYRDVLPILESAYEPAETARGSDDLRKPSQAGYGFVYLVRGHPGEYKLGRTNLVDRRLSELGVLSAVEQTLIHEIKTDDPVGVEAYWHNRFASKRMRGEWFRLSGTDVAAFKRWKRLF